MDTTTDVIYFWFSMIFLIGRATAVLLFAAQVYDESKKPSTTLCRVPIDCWCSEASRFYDEINNGFVALSGKRFFYLTRKLILGVRIKHHF